MFLLIPRVLFYGLLRVWFAAPLAPLEVWVNLVSGRYPPIKWAAK